MRSIIGACLFVFLVHGMAQNAFAQAVVGPVPSLMAEPTAMCDSIRGAIGNILSLFPIGDEPVLGAIINVTEGEADALINGDTSWEVDEGTGAASNKDLNLATYDYVKEKIFDNSKKTPYEPLNNKIKSGGDMAAIVKEMFFIADADAATEDKEAEIMANRKEYLKTVGRDYTRMAYGIQEKLIDDMGSVSADLDGNGTIGSVAGMDQTWKAINKALIADIALQIELMELDAAKFLSVQPLVIMDKDPPSSSGNGGGNT